MQDGVTQQGLPPELQVTTTSRARRPMSKAVLWIIIVSGIILLFSLVCVVFIGINIYQSGKAKQPIEFVLDDYMQFMDIKDAGKAHALYSPRAQRQISISKIQEMYAGNNYYLYKDYDNLTVTCIVLASATNTNADAPQGIVANVQGVITYEDGFKGAFTGILEKMNGKWMIDSMNVTVSPDKIE